MNSEILKNAIQAAGEHPAALSFLRELYVDLEKEIAARKPKCEMSGKCCHFEEFGHRLYVTGLELADFRMRLNIASPVNALVDRKSNCNEKSPQPAKAPAALLGCPFQENKICSVHAIRPMGCRIFFCDPTAKEWMEDLYARFHAKVKAIHAQFDIPYVYVEWREGLSL